MKYIRTIDMFEANLISRVLKELGLRYTQTVLELSWQEIHEAYPEVRDAFNILTNSGHQTFAATRYPKDTIFSLFVFQVKVK